jgi:hypothetical protein
MHAAGSFSRLGFTNLVIFEASWGDLVPNSQVLFYHGTHADSKILRVWEGSANLAVLLLPVHVCEDAERTPAASS